MSLAFRVYVAAPYEDAQGAAKLHATLEGLGFAPCSSWVVQALDSRDRSNHRALSPSARRELSAAADQNDRDLASADLCIVLARPGAGGAMFGEARIAIAWGIPVLWCGRMTLDAHRPGVDHVEGLVELFARLRGVARGAVAPSSIARPLFDRMAARRALRVEHLAGEPPARRSSPEVEGDEHGARLATASSLGVPVQEERHR